MKFRPRMPAGLRRCRASWEAWTLRRRAAVLLAAFSLLAGVVGYFEWQDSRALSDGTAASATVLDYDNFLLDKSPPTVRVKFRTAEGQEVTTGIVRFRWPDPRKGDVVQIEYARSAGSLVAQQAGYEPRFHVTWGFLIASGASALLATFLLAWSIVRPEPIEDAPPPPGPHLPMDMPDWRHRTGGES